MTKVVRRKRRARPARGRRGGGKSHLEEEFVRLWGLFKEPGLPDPVRELRFDRSGVRRWRFDFAWKRKDGGGVAVEVQGGVFTGGRHSRGAGIHSDLTKQNAAIEQGWSVLGYTAVHLKKEPAETIRQVCAVVRDRIYQPLSQPS